MTYTFDQYKESADSIRRRIGAFCPKVAMILGSGLGFLGDVVEDPVCVSYRDIPHFKASTAPGHKGQLVFGTLEGRPVAVMQGRMHHYEGYSYEEVSYAVRVLRLLGCDTLIVTNAAGCVNTAWDALETATVNGARALGRKAGRVAPGYTADLILVDFDRPNLIPCHDTVENLVYAAHGADVCMNMARGRVIYQNGAFLTIDLDRVKREIRDYALPLLFG